MRKFLMAVAAVAVMAGTAGVSSEARANCGGSFCGMSTGAGAWAGFGAAALVVGGALYLIANHNAPAGSLAAAAPSQNMRDFARNAQEYTATPAYALVPVSSNLAAVK